MKTFYQASGESSDESKLDPALSRLCRMKTIPRVTPLIRTTITDKSRMDKQRVNENAESYSGMVVWGGAKGNLHPAIVVPETE